MKCLIIGASGQVGGLLLKSCLAEKWECRGTSFKHGAEGLSPLDIANANAVEDSVKSFRPDVVFLPGAMTYVDYCETHAHECYATNIDGTANVARAVKEAGGTLVFFSTEHVFRDSPTEYLEDAPVAPLSVYAKSKVGAEERLREILPGRHLILRASWVYGPEEQRKNFVYRAVCTLRAGSRLQVPDDQFGQPTYSVDLASTAIEMLNKGIHGTFHAVGPAHITRLAFAQLIARVFSLDAALIDGISTKSLNQPAPRPLFIKLKRDKLMETLGIDPIRHPEAALMAMRDGAERYRP